MVCASAKNLENALGTWEVGGLYMHRVLALKKIAHESLRKADLLRRRKERAVSPAFDVNINHLPYLRLNNYLL